MGSTIELRQRAGAIVAANGTIFYGLFSETYESNVYPKTPHWGCMYFGDAAGCMRRIIQIAAATEGGMLKGPKGNMTPTSYLNRWRKALAEPFALTLNRVSSTVGEGFRKIDPKHHDAMVTLLGKHGQSLSSDGAFEIDLVEKPALLQEILEQLNVGAWRFIDGLRCSNDVIDWAGYRPVQCASDDLDVKVFYAQQTVNEERNHWVVLPNGKVEFFGWAYSTIDYLIREYATQSELAQPGSAESMIRKVRRLVEQESTAMPLDQPISACRNKAEQEWNARSYDSLAKKLQRSASQLSTTLKEVIGSDALYELTHLPMSMLQFPQLAAYAKERKFSQVDLFAA